jgi:2-oxoglutarate ferredoxin oxidoreductase subunit beta
MTGGQCSPTTPTNYLATTATFGNIDQPFDISHIAQAAGASFVGRSTVFHTKELQNIISKALQNKGFGVVEALSNCHTYFGRLNKHGNAPDMLKWFKENTVSISVPEDKREGKITRGIFIDKEMTGFSELYRQLVEKACFQKEEVLKLRASRKK